jgi:hypothetical protein
MENVMTFCVTRSCVLSGRVITVAAVVETLNELESSDNPLLASPQGGVAERSRDTAKHPLFARPGWFSDENKRYTTPAASS